MQQIMSIYAENVHCMTFLKQYITEVLLSFKCNLSYSIMGSSVLFVPMKNEHKLL